MPNTTHNALRAAHLDALVRQRQSREVPAFVQFDELRLHPETWTYCRSSQDFDRGATFGLTEDGDPLWEGMRITRMHELPEGTALFCFGGDVLQRATHLPHRTEA